MTTHYMYIAGKHEDDYALITIELLKITDVSNVLKKPENLHTGFYHGGLINSGKIISIETLADGKSLPYADVNLRNSNGMPTTTIRMHLHKFFFTEIDDGTGLRVFRHKAGALNYVQFIPPLYTGVRYYYFQNGLLKKKSLLENGDVVREIIYRNDAFNTIESINQYENNTLSVVCYYTEDEVLRRKVFYDANGGEKS